MMLRLAALLLLATLLPVRAQPLTPAQRQEVVGIVRDALVRDPTILRDALAALQTDETRRHEQVTRDLLAMVGPRLVTPADPVEGNAMADVTVVEFYDTRCPYCRQMGPVLAELLQEDPRVRLVPKDMPVLGPASQLESRALLAAQKQGGYFPMQNAIMNGRGNGTRDGLRDLANGLGLDGNALLRDIDDPGIKARLQSNLDLAHDLGVEGTPAFVIGTRLIPGAADLKELQAAVTEARNQRLSGRP